MFRRIKQLVGLVILFISKFSLRSVDLNIYGSWFGEKFSDNSAYLFLTELEKEGKKYMDHKEQAIKKATKRRNTDRVCVLYKRNILSIKS